MSSSPDSYNKGGFYALMLSITFCLLFFVYIAFIHPGIHIDQLKESTEGTEMQMAGGDSAAAVDVSQIEKPWVENPDMVAHGAKVYANNCAVCHGPKGMGDGPAGSGLVPKPRNLVEGKWVQGGSSIELYKTLAGGIPGTSMAAFGHIPKVDRWALVQFIHSITENKVQDDAAKLDQFAASAE